jgi:hypothetical protein
VNVPPAAEIERNQSFPGGMTMKTNSARLGLTLFAAALLLLVGAGSATAATQSLRDQTNFSIFVPCANGGLGETVEGIAKVHVVTGETTDENGGVHLHAQITLRGVGIGTVTDDKYQFHADEPFLFPNRINDPAEESFNGAFNFNFSALGLGDAPNFSGTWRQQITVNANGVVTMEKGLMTETCK